MPLWAHGDLLCGGSLSHPRSMVEGIASFPPPRSSSLRRPFTHERSGGIMRKRRERFLARQPRATQARTEGGCLGKCWWHAVVRPLTPKWNDLMITVSASLDLDLRELRERRI
jgi:hypothetical protein